MKELNKKADENHNKNLLKNYGFLPWRRLIKNREKIMKNADDFYKKNLLKTEFLNGCYTREMNVKDVANLLIKCVKLHFFA